MIFVTVGMHYQGFERLIREMDDIAGKIDEKVIMQIGSSSYYPKNCEYFDYVDEDDKIKSLSRDARIIVSHGGAGNILTALALKKRIIIVPRLRKYNEHIDDQQLELAKALSDNGRAMVVTDVNHLRSAIDNIDNSIPISTGSNDQLIKFLKNSLGDFS